MDIDERRLAVMQELGEKLIDGRGKRSAVRSTLDQRESLVGADFVIAAISVGGFDAWATTWRSPADTAWSCTWPTRSGRAAIMRAFRNAPVLAEVARNVAEVAPDAYVFNYTNPAPTEALAMRAAAPGREDATRCARARAIPAAPSGWPTRPASRPADIAMPPVVAGINHCASVQQLRLKDGSDAMPLVRERTTNPIVRWALDTYGVLPYCWSHWVEHYPQMQWLEGPYAGHRAGRQDAVRHHHPRHGLREGAGGRAGDAGSELDRARRRAGHAGRPAGGRRGLGHRGDRHHRGHRRQPERDLRDQRAPTTARSRTCRPTRSSR